MNHGARAVLVGRDEERVEVTITKWTKNEGNFLQPHMGKGRPKHKKLHGYLQQRSRSSLMEPPSAGKDPDRFKYVDP